MRRFNRLVTRRVGALDDRYLARGRPLGQARLLWEVGPDGEEVRRLRARLGLDAAQLSRQLRALESDGLVHVGRGDADGRVSVVRLTAAGAVERQVLDDLSDDLARSILEPLEPAQRERLVAAMGEVERLLMASAVTLRVVDPESPDARQCVRAYMAELDRRSPVPYDPGAGVSARPDEFRAPLGAFVVGTLGHEAVCCGAVKHVPGCPAEVKRMWVSDAVRGLGVGRRLLRHLERLAAAAGATAVRLETNRTLVEAIGLYRSEGYSEVPAFNDEPFAHHWFQKQLTGAGG
ncbi:MAG: MarR family winged helix-turn-helix transcriptional regulator [Thermoleophilia bacterium]